MLQFIRANDIIIISFLTINKTYSQMQRHFDNTNEIGLNKMAYIKMNVCILNHIHLLRPLL